MRYVIAIDIDRSGVEGAPPDESEVVDFLARLYEGKVADRSFHGYWYVSGIEIQDVISS